MAKKRTEKSKYTSPSSGEYCTAAQWLAETMCQRVALKNNEGSLAYKFWNDKKWKKTYGWQVVCANRLISQFGEETVITYIRDNERILSLGVGWLKKKLADFKPIMDRKLAAEREAMEKTQEIKETEKDGSEIKRKKKSLASRLK